MPGDPHPRRVGGPCRQGGRAAHRRSGVAPLPAVHLRGRVRGRGRPPGPDSRACLPSRSGRPRRRLCRRRVARSRRNLGAEPVGSLPARARQPPIAGQGPRRARDLADGALHALPGSARDPTNGGGGEMKEGHLPVLAEEVLAMLQPRPGSLQIDATVGGGGHTERILEATNPDGRLLGLDADGAAIARVDGRLRPRFGDRLVLRRANFRELVEVAPEAGFDAVDGCLFDLGLSSFQLTDTERGFGFRAGGPLDMRFDTNRGVPAAELLATLDRIELSALFKRYGEEPQANRIANAI